MEHKGLYECNNCGKQFWHLNELKLEIPHYHERVEPDGPDPAGECPECGALCYEVE